MSEIENVKQKFLIYGVCFWLYNGMFLWGGIKYLLLKNWHQFGLCVLGAITIWVGYNFSFYKNKWRSR